MHFSKVYRDIIFNSKIRITGPIWDENSSKVMGKNLWQNKFLLYQKKWYNKAFSSRVLALKNNMGKGKKWSSLRENANQSGYYVILRELHSKNW